MNKLFAILQKYDFSSKSQPNNRRWPIVNCCLRYCKSTIFQANHNYNNTRIFVVLLFAILQKYDFSSKSQLCAMIFIFRPSCLRYCKSTIFQANHNPRPVNESIIKLFAILQKYDFSSKSQLPYYIASTPKRCLRYCKSTIFQANHNFQELQNHYGSVVCDTAKVRFFKQITTAPLLGMPNRGLFAILQKYDFSSKSQRDVFTIC